MAFNILNSVDIAYDNKVYGNIIDPYEWNQNFIVAEGGINNNVVNTNDNFTLLSSSFGAAEIGSKAIESIGETTDSNVAVQLTTIANKIANSYTKEEVTAIINALKNSIINKISYDGSNGKFTITYEDGDSYVIDTNLEKIPESVSLVEDTANKKVYLRITNTDGSYTQADVTDLLNIYTFNSTSEIQVADSGDNTYSFSLKDGSIGVEKLSLSMITQLEGYVNAASISAASASSFSDSAANSANSASNSALSSNTAKLLAEGYKDNANDAALLAKGHSEEASASAIESRSWAVGGTNTRTGEDTNNAKYWSEKAMEIAGGDFVTNSEFGTYKNESEDALNKKVGYEDIVNDLLQTTSGKVLDATQGYVLYEKILNFDCGYFENVAEHAETADTHSNLFVDGNAVETSLFNEDLYQHIVDADTHQNLNIDGGEMNG